jgi:hypothetical protein
MHAIARASDTSIDLVPRDVDGIALSVVDRGAENSAVRALSRAALGKIPGGKVTASTTMESLVQSIANEKHSDIELLRFDPHAQIAQVFRCVA